MNTLRPATYRHIGTTESNLLSIREDHLQKLMEQRDRFRAVALAAGDVLLMASVRSFNGTGDRAVTRLATALQSAEEVMQEDEDDLEMRPPNNDPCG